jgi:hypothetical protein
VGVQVRRNGRGRVAEPFRDDFELDAGCEGEARAGVSEVVQPDQR